MIDHDSRAVEILDFAGAPSDSVIAGLRRPRPTLRPLSTLLVAPFHSIGNLGKAAQACLKEHDRIFPHLDLDHIGEAVELGWKDGMSLGIFEVDEPCFEDIVLA